MNTIQTFSIKVPLVSFAHEYAQQFALEQTTSTKGKQVYLNTLAVYAVHSFLQLMDIGTDISKGNSWHPIYRRFHNVSDLVLPKFGSLECRPVLPGEKFISVPKEATENRLGLVAVQFEESLDDAQILGFVKTNNSGLLPQQIELSKLQSMEQLLDRLEQIAANQMVNLGQWLDNLIDAGWQTVEAVFGSNLILARVRRSPSVGVVQAKRINDELALVVAVMPTATEERQIIIQVHPIGSQTLPPGVKSIILDEFGKELLQESAKKADNWIQLKIDGKPGEQFRLIVAMGEASFTEDFMI
ncbi:DUF1822 family protein [Iningainema tapete]|uniref:DUF1822 family protein n=1 Tax=Iningainema tapete BLCC-T55 TaxID=2748662 RepID=A0A8J6XIP2_9CYAN|nr:DUF1822 family protein [Iningainema tapete]MBD2770947.1 DUF1822 family protein [Iningainema tapete BLCC-T55]